MQIISSYADETVIMLRSFEADPKSSMMDPLHPLVLSLCRHIKELPLVTFQPRLSPILLHFLLLSHSIRCSTCNQFPGLAGSSSEVQVIIQVCLFTHSSEKGLHSCLGCCFYRIKIDNDSGISHLLHSGYLLQHSAATDSCLPVVSWSGKIEVNTTCFSKANIVIMQLGSMEEAGAANAFFSGQLQFSGCSFWLSQIAYIFQILCTAALSDKYPAAAQSL